MKRNVVNVFAWNRIVMGTVLVLAAHATAHAQSYLDAGVYSLKNYVSAGHCDSGGRNCDLKPAFDAALAACDTLRVQENDDVGRGCVFLVPEGKHRLSGTVELCRAHVIRGEGFANGMSGDAAATTIVADDTAFKMRGYQHCQLSVPTSIGGGTHIVGLQLVASAAAQASTTANFGIKIEAPGLVQNVSIRGFVVGLRIVANDPVSLANVFGLVNVDVRESRYAGIFVRGNDVNAGSGYHISATNNCTQGDHWKTRAIDGDAAQGFCAAIVDKSFLGNTWVGLHSAVTRDVTTATKFPGFFFEGLTQDSVCLGCYSDHVDQTSNVMGNPTVVIGGASEWRLNQGGFRLRGYGANVLTVLNTVDPANMQEMTLGGGASFGLRMTFRANWTPKADFSVRYDALRKGFAFQVDNINHDNGGSLTLIGEHGSPLAPSASPAQLLFVAPFLANPCVFQQSCPGP
jgi:hypothetical protein